MDFAWVVDALRRGLKVTRKAWAGDPPMYLYMSKKMSGESVIMLYTGTDKDSEWSPRAALLLDADDWEEYVKPKKDIQLHSVTGEIIKATPEEMPLWPGVNADGYARLSKDSDVLIHDGVYRPKKKPVEEPDLDAETNKAIALVARNIAENLVELLRNPSVQRILHG